MDKITVKQLLLCTDPVNIVELYCWGGEAGNYKRSGNPDLLLLALEQKYLDYCVSVVYGHNDRISVHADKDNVFEPRNANAERICLCRNTQTN